MTLSETAVTFETPDGAPTHLTLTVWTRDYPGYAMAHGALAEAIEANLPWLEAMEEDAPAASGVAR